MSAIYRPTDSDAGNGAPPFDAWIYNSMNGSLFLVMVAHAGHNIATELVRIPAEGTHVVPVVIALLYLAAAMAVVPVAGPRTFSRPNAR